MHYSDTAVVKCVTNLISLSERFNVRVKLEIADVALPLKASLLLKMF